MTVEHRSAPAMAPLRLRLVSRPDGRQTHLELVDRPAAPVPPEGSVEDRVMAQIGAASRPVTRQDLREGLRINNQRLGDVLVALERTGRITRTPTGWSLPTAP